MSTIQVLTALLIDGAAASKEPTTQDDLTSPQFLAACVAAIAALTAAGISWFSGRKQRRQSDQHREIDFRRAQLNELYGPLVMWREASKRTRDLLPHEVDGKEWRLVDHIEEVRDGEHADWEAAVEQILQISKEVETLLTTKAGLFENLPPREGYTLFLAHAGRLRLYWERGRNQPADKRLPFPGEQIDRDIAAELEVVKGKLEQLGVRSR